MGILIVDMQRSSQSESYINRQNISSKVCLFFIGTIFKHHRVLYNGYVVLHYINSNLTHWFIDND